MIREIVAGLRNMVAWLPLIWKDRQWDQAYLIRILHKKLELMEKHMRSKDCVKSVHQDQYIKQVLVCKNLAKRIVEHNYLDNALARHHQIYGDEIRVRFDDVEGMPGFRQMVFEEEPSERKSFSRAGKHADKMEKQDYHLLFTLLRKHIRNWWD